MTDKAWNGVRWCRVSEGECVVHGVRVGWSGLCPVAHAEQLAAARAGSREWERKPSTARRPR